MKKLIILLITIVPSIVFSQNDTTNVIYDEWYQYEFDSLITFSAPGEEIYLMDTIINGKALFSYYIYYQTKTSTVIRALLEPNNTGKISSKLPHDIETLKECYKGIVNGFTKTNTFFKPSKESFFEKKDYLACSIDLLDIDTYKQIGKVEFLVLNNSVYTFMNYDEGVYDKEYSNIFFNSIQITPTAETNQFTGEDTAYKIGYIIGQLIFVGAIILIVVIVVNNNRKKNTNNSKGIS